MRHYGRRGAWDGQLPLPLELDAPPGPPSSHRGDSFGPFTEGSFVDDFRQKRGAEGYSENRGFSYRSGVDPLAEHSNPYDVPNVAEGSNPPAARTSEEYQLTQLEYTLALALCEALEVTG